MTRTKYSDEFKEQVVREILEKERTIASVAASYDLVPQTVGVRGRPGTGWIVIKVPTPITTAVTRARTACNPMERSRASRGSGNEANTPAAIYDPGGATWGAAQPPHSWGSPMSSSRRTA